MPSDVQHEYHGKFAIRSGKMAGVWNARAFRGKAPIGDAASGESRTAAVERIRTELARVVAEEKASREPDGSPSARAYVDAFARLGKLPDGYKAMLNAHLNAVDYLITATQLAEAAGYSNWNAANLHYGTLGRKLAGELDFTPPNRADGSPIWTSVLAVPGSSDHLEPDQLFAALERSFDKPHFEWLLRPQVVSALQ